MSKAHIIERKTFKVNRHSRGRDRGWRTLYTFPNHARVSVILGEGSYGLEAMDSGGDIHPHQTPCQIARILRDTRSAR